MKKSLQAIALLLLATTSVMADPTITLTTDKEYGDKLSLIPVPAVAGTIRIDWGDGNPESYEMDPKDMTYLLRKEHKLLGDTIIIYGALGELSCYNEKLTSVKLTDQSTLKKLSLNQNLLTYANLDLGDATELTSLNLSQNQIELLNLQKFGNLQYVDLYGNPDLTTVVFADNNPNMKGITAYDTDLIHFYDNYKFPVLNVLDLHNTSLYELTLTPGNYPALTNLDLSGNRLTDLDVSGLSTLEKLNLADNNLSKLNIAANEALSELNIKGNRNIDKLNLASNAKMHSLNVSCTGLESLDVNHMSELTTLTADSLNITKLDVSELAYLSSFSAEACQLSYLDFTANYFRLKSLYLRGNKNFTAQSLNFMYQTIHNPDYSRSRIYVSGCTGAEQADAEKYLNLDDYDCNWKIDVEGDGSASMNPVQLTLKPAQGGTYQVYRRKFNNLDNYFKKHYEEATDGKVVPGFVNVVRFTADEGKGFRGVKVNGEFIPDSLFFVTADAEIEAIFGDGEDASLDKYIAFSVYSGQESQYGFAADKAETEIMIDWGDGNLVKDTIGNTSFTYIDGQTEGTTVKVYGDVSYINIDSYPYGYGIDNRIKGIDLSHNDGIRQLTAYSNELTSIDVTNQPNLQYLDISMNSDIESLDVTGCPELKKLVAYTTEIESIDLHNNTKLQYLDIKNAWLDELNVENCTDLRTLIVSNNDLSQLDVTKLSELDILLVSGNKIGAIDLSANTKMRELNISGNALTKLDLSNNTRLEKLDASNNEIDLIDLSGNKEIWYVDVRGNRWDACTVNDFMHLLPDYVSPGEEAEASTTSTKLWIDGDNGKEGASNDVAHSETKLLNGKSWITNIFKEGDGTGCDRSYVYVLQMVHGDAKMVDAEGTEVASGTAVQKGTELTVVASPEEGYYNNAIYVNGTSLTGNTFTVEKLTDVSVRFKLISSDLNKIDRTLATAQGGRGAICIESNEEVEVLITSLSGQRLYNALVNGEAEVKLPAGLYLVSLTQGKDTITKKLMVK